MRPQRPTATGRGSIVGGAARDEALVHHDLLVDPGGSGVAEVGREARVAGERASVDDAGLDRSTFTRKS